MKFNPFRPGGIVSPGMFAGRLDELATLEQMLFQTKNGNPQHFLLAGERGIGKSSLLYKLTLIAQGKLTFSESTKFNFLTPSIELEATDTAISIIKKIGKSLNEAVAKRTSLKEVAKAGWDFLKRWEVLGVKYNASTENLEGHELLEALCTSLQNTLEKFGQEIDGCLILIDEADKPINPEVGALAKLFTERLTKLDCTKVALGLAGVAGIVGKLRESHDSAPRIFHSLTIEPLSRVDRLTVIRKGLEAAEEKNNFQTQIKPDAEEAIASLSEGYPNFIQQFSYCAFEADTDSIISLEDVGVGANKKDGAFHQLGQKYFSELYFEQIGSDEYRQVLRAMAQHDDGWVTKAQLREAVNLKPATLANAISALKKRNIIAPQPGKQGVYKLPTRAFAVWIRASTVDPKMVPESADNEAPDEKGQLPSSTIRAQRETSQEEPPDSL